VGEKEKAFDKLVEAERACLRARDLTQQLLTFAKGGAPIKKPTSMAGLVKESAMLADAVLAPRFGSSCRMTSGSGNR